MFLYLLVEQTVQNYWIYGCIVRIGLVTSCRAKEQRNKKLFFQLPALFSVFLQFFIVTSGGSNATTS